MSAKVLVWDAPVRVFHWLLAASIAGSFLTAESERLRDVHVALGYTALGLLLFRIVWGFVGSRHARFSAFAFGPHAVLRYLWSVARGDPEHHVGHNPAGSWGIYAMLALGLLTAAAGMLANLDHASEWMEEFHEGLANSLLVLVAVHVAAVVASSFLHRENLVGAMLTGYKRGEIRHSITGARWLVAAMLVAGVTVFWTCAI